MRVHALLVGLAVLGSPAGLRAEEPVTVAVGSRVRVTSQETGARPLVGQVVALEQGGVVVADEAGRGPRRVSLAPSTMLEVSRGKKSQAASGAMIGAAAGALPGLLMTFGDYNTDERSPAAVSLVGAAAGAAIGSLIGLAFRSEGWQRAELPVVTADIAPVARGASVSLTLAWGGGPRARR